MELKAIMGVWSRASNVVQEQSPWCDGVVQLHGALPLTSKAT